MKEVKEKEPTDKPKQGKKNRASGARFELKVRENLENQGWTVSKWQNQIEFEAICIKTGKDKYSASESLRKYHLYLEEKEQYPKGRKAVFAGFEKWLMNEKKFSNGTHQQTSNPAKQGTSEARTEALKKW